MGFTEESGENADWTSSSWDVVHKWCRRLLNERSSASELGSTFELCSYHPPSPDYSPTNHRTTVCDHVTSPGSI